jgi:hypothetical protein
MTVQWWIRVRVKNGGQIIEMHRPVALAMLAGGTAVLCDERGRQIDTEGNLVGVRPVENAMRSNSNVEYAANVKKSQRGGAVRK